MMNADSLLPVLIFLSSFLVAASLRQAFRVFRGYNSIVFLWFELENVFTTKVTKLTKKSNGSWLGFSFRGKVSGFFFQSVILSVFEFRFSASRVRCPLLVVGCLFLFRELLQGTVFI